MCVCQKNTVDLSKHCTRNIFATMGQRADNPNIQKAFTNQEEKDRHPIENWAKKIAHKRNLDSQVY